MVKSHSLSIRPAIAGDVPLLNTMIHELATFERLEASITEETLLRDGFGPRPAFRALIAESQGASAGYALFFSSYNSFQGRSLFLEDIYVREPFRGKGIGKAMLARLAAIAQAENCLSILFHVLDWNANAINAYRALGATLLDEWKVFCLEGRSLEALAQLGNQETRP